VYGLYTRGLFNVSQFSHERRVHIANKPVGYLGTLLVGIAFGAGWTPCIGPILGSILTYAASSADLKRGLWLLLAYSLGLAVPFLLSAVAVERFLDFFTRMKRQMNWITRTSGVLMVAVGILLVTNYFTVLASALQAMTPEALRSRL
jgi:cytochrome c-type biogenesis protein